MPAEGHQQVEAQPPFLSSLSAAMAVVHDQGADILTKDFTALMDCIIRVFDYLGSVLHFAKADVFNKNESLKQAGARFKTLKEMVEADRAAGTMTVKNSNARNLHRLMSVVSFVYMLFKNLLDNKDTPMRQAATAAYNDSLAKIHTYMVRTAVWAGFYAVPSRQAFLESIGETDESAKDHATAIIQWARPLVAEVEKLIGQQMPASDRTWI